ncbi:type III secretion system gatekeeper subunit SctW [Candidatus Symbiopectobacterium sp. NZEC135]|uniref:type III secretion system gatekeeper subunit SctW n=1 Tax=Candidatus Symbiopectobacterium sp. NZEC135 TaxID=2820471 RepID=UPI00222652F6|nr:type III secretion system gatekeeper subunit SctW [Candidatus Symbiopectobacterium sp. NZEC135]MCW2481276.1 type III secretion system gatekeeper subunit SctW [Candidatus Symbiopectobacterium sp. NZEC135]
MAISVGSGSSTLQLQMARREKQNAEKNVSAEQNNVSSGDEMQDTEDLSPAARAQKLYHAADDMSAVAGRFRQRREYEKKSSAMGESSFDRVLDDDAQPKVSKLIQALNGKEGAAIMRFLQQARALFPDESDLVMVLRELLYRRNLDEIRRKRLKAMLSLVEKEADPKRLKAGINVALKARLLGSTLKMTPTLLRESYRSFLANDDTDLMQYQTWISTYGVENRGILTTFMEDALLADIDAVDPSCSHSEFFFLQERIMQIKRIRSSDILFVQGLLNNPLIRDVDEKEETWLLLLFGMIENTDDVDILLSQTVGHPLRFAEHKNRALVLQMIYYYFKKLPHEVFFLGEERIKLLMYFEEKLNTALYHERIEQRKTAQ